MLYLALPVPPGDIVDALFSGVPKLIAIRRRALAIISDDGELTAARMALLRIVCRYNDQLGRSVSIRELAQVTGTSAANITQLARYLDEEDLVESRPCRIDRRWRALRPTELGRTVALDRGCRMLAETVYTELADELGPEDAGELLRTLVGLAQRLPDE